MDLVEILGGIAINRTFQHMCLVRQPRSKLLLHIHLRMDINRHSSAPSEIRGSKAMDETGLSSPLHLPIDCREEETTYFHKTLEGKRSRTRSSATIQLQRGWWTPNQPFIQYLNGHKLNSKLAKRDLDTSKNKVLSRGVKTVWVTLHLRLKFKIKTISSQLCNNSLEA